MSDETPMTTVDQLAKSLRDSAGADAETRWKADEARKAAQQEATTEYLRQRTAIDAAEADLLAKHRAAIEESIARQTTAMERIAAALEARSR